MPLDSKMELTQEDLFYLDDLLINIKKSITRLEHFIEIKQKGLLDAKKYFNKKSDDKT